MDALASRARRPAPPSCVARVAANVGRVVHAPEETLRLAVLCLVGEGHLIIEDFPGVGKTMLAKALARSVDCSFSRLQFTPDLLPVGRHRRQRLRPAHERVRLPPRAGLREPAARRRDQPRVAEDAVGAARVHAGEPGHGRRRHLRAAAAVHGAWRRRTRSSTRAPTRSPRRSSTASRCASRSATRRSPTRRGCCASRRASRRSTRSSRSRPRTRSARDRRGARGLRRGERQPLRRRACCATRAATRGSSSGASPRAGVALLRVAKARALADGRDYVQPDDVKALAVPGARAPADRRARAALGRADRRGRVRDALGPHTRPGVTRRGRLTLGARRASCTLAAWLFGVASALPGRDRTGCSPRLALAPGCALRGRPVAADAALQAGDLQVEGDDVALELVLELDARAPARGRSRSPSSSAGSASTASPSRRTARFATGRVALRRAARPLRLRAAPPRRSRTRSGSQRARVAARGRRRAARVPAPRRARPAVHRERRARRGRPAAAAAPAERLRPARRARAPAGRVAARACTGPRRRKRGELMVKDLEDAPRDELAVVLDAAGARARAELRRAGPRRRLAAAGVRLAAGAPRCSRSTARSPSTSTSLPNATGSAAYDALAAAEPDGATPVARAARARRRARLARVGELVVVTAAIPRALVDRLVAARAAAGRRAASSTSTPARSPGAAPCRRRICCASRPPALRSPSRGAATTWPASSAASRSGGCPCVGRRSSAAAGGARGRVAGCGSSSRHRHGWRRRCVLVLALAPALLRPGC